MTKTAKPESYFEEVLGQMSEGCQVLGSDWRYLYLNEVAVRHARRKKSELLGRSILEVYPGIEETPMFSKLSESMATRTPAAFDYEFIYPDQSAAWFELVFRPVAAGILILSLDVTERRRTEEALRAAMRAKEQNLAQFDALFSAAPVGLGFCDRDLHFVRLNQALAKMIGLPVEAHIGRHVREVLPDLQGLDRLIAAWEGVVASGEPLRGLEIAGMTDAQPGRRIWRSNFFPVRIGDEIVGLGATALDITERKAVERALRESEERLNLALAASRMGVWEWDLRTDTVFLSPECYTILGVADFEPSFEAFARSLHPEDVAEVITSAKRALAEKTVYAAEFRFLRPGGEVCWLSSLGRGKYDQEGNALRMVGTIQDITERKAAEAALFLRHRAIEASGNGIVICDASQKDLPILYVNPAFERLTGYPVAEAMGRSPNFLTGEDVDLVAALHRHEEAEVELRVVRKDRTPLWSELSVAPVRDVHGRITHFVAILNDIGDRKRYEQELEHQANHDALTGLANRILLTDRLEQNLIYANRSGRIVAILLLDLDRFKVINDSLGHSHGDELLRMVAARLKECVRPGDTVSRLGGDEFVIALAEVADLGDVGLLAKRIRDRLAESFSLAGHELRVTASIGISLYPKDGDAVEALVRHADMAMYQAKGEGGDTFRFFAPEMNVRIRGTLELEADLRLALERGEFFLEYQPLVDIASGRIVGGEALVRWQHPRRGLVSPGAFIPLAEETGLIVPLGEWVLRQACTEAKAWQKERLQPVKIAVNLSARQFRQAGLIDQVQAALSEADLSPAMLELELTESMIMPDSAGAAETMRQLKSLGVRLCLDDFGTGFSSLNYLRRFPVDCLKIDRSFITDVASDASGAAVATSIVAIAHSLGLEAVAEGVETWEQYDFLAHCRCDALQGFLFSKPVPPAEFVRLLRQERSLIRSPGDDPAHLPMPLPATR